MCDCYGHPCAVPGCGAIIEMHLEDFSTGRHEILVFCEEHLHVSLRVGDHIPRARIWEWSDSEAEKPRKWHRCKVVPLTDNAAKRARGNHPNTWHCRDPETKEEA